MNTKFALLAALGTLGLMAAAPQAQAADNGFYLGAGVSQSNTELSFDEIGSGDADDTGFKVIAGFRPLDFLAVEANYIDLGGDDAEGTSIDSSALSVSALFLAEVGIVDLYARVGYANWDTKFAAEGESISDDGWEPTYGVGVGVHFGSIGVRAEYERLEAEPFEDEVGGLDLEFSTITLSVTYTFL
jgi:outer membrane protein with beta-barrel domain